MRYDAVRAVFTDLDGTLTTGGRLATSTFDAVAALAEAGIEVVIVTGRPAGWGHAMFRLWPVRAVVTENGGVTFLRTASARGAVREVKRYGVPVRTLPAVRRRMTAAASRVLRQVRGARMAADTPYTEVNMAIDWNEDVHLPEAKARRIEALLRAAGFNAVRSSVHVNFWPGGFDKLTACRAVVKAMGGDPKDLSPYLYFGDALNDEPMFAGFPRSVGVANVRKVWDELGAKPAHVTAAAEGAGFEEVARVVLAGRRGATRIL
jgi:HAD superfamily hydrolase (TIGR01484 family)